MSFDPTVDGLREALVLSPDNLPLRRLLANALLERGYAAQAEAEFRKGLAQAAGDPELSLGLATAFHVQGKLGEAFVVAEELAREVPSAPVFALLARLHLADGDPEGAAKAYRYANEFDPSVVVEELDGELDDDLGFGDEAELQAASLARPEGVRDPAGAIEFERPGISFQDVGGMESLKDEIRIKIIEPLQRPELFAAYGKAAGGGILLYGPPGCGKTYLARATAGEIDIPFRSIGLNDVLDMYIGESERKLHELFQLARRTAPCVLFFDEVDALGASRSDMRQHAGRKLINQFLAELDGATHSNEGVLIVGATNAPWHLDSAFRRPGRFDRVLFVPPPDQAARAEILRLHARNVPIEPIDFAEFAKRTDGYSGADLKGIVDVAVESKVRDAIRAGAPVPVTSKDLASALKAANPSTHEWFAQARNYVLYANQGGTYDDVSRYLGL